MNTISFGASREPSTMFHGCGFPSLLGKLSFQIQFETKFRSITNQIWLLQINKHFKWDNKQMAHLNGNCKVTDSLHLQREKKFVRDQAVWRRRMYYSKQERRRVHVSTEIVSYLFVELPFKIIMIEWWNSLHINKWSCSSSMVVFWSRFEEYFDLQHPFRSLLVQLFWSFGKLTDLVLCLISCKLTDLVHN